MTIMKGFRLTALAAALALGAASAHAQALQLRSGFFMGNQPSPYVTAFKQFIDEVNETGGEHLGIGSYVGPESIQRNQWCNAIRSGILDIIAVGPALCNNLIRISEGLNGQTNSFAEQRQNGGYDFLREVIARDANSHFLGQFGSGARFHFWSNRPIASLEDLKSVRLRNTASLRAIYDELGIDGIEVELNQVYTSVQSGVLNGATLPANVIKPLGLHEVLTHRVDPGFYNPVMMVLVNKNLWERMTDDQRAILERAIIRLETEFNDGFEETNDAMAAELEELGLVTVTLSDEEAERLRAVASEKLWATVEETSPEEGPKMRTFLDPSPRS